MGLLVGLRVPGTIFIKIDFWVRHRAPDGTNLRNFRYRTPPTVAWVLQAMIKRSKYSTPGIYIYIYKVPGSFFLQGDVRYWRGRPRVKTVPDYSRASTVPVPTTTLGYTEQRNHGATAGYTLPRARTNLTWARVCFNPFRASRPFPPAPPAPAEAKSKFPSFSSRNLGSLRASFPTLTDTELVRRSRGP